MTCAARRVTMPELNVRITAMREEITALRRLVAEKDAVIDRLQAELDGLREAPVEYVPRAGLDAAMAITDREDGAIIRELGAEKRAWEWKAAAKTWEQMT